MDKNLEKILYGTLKMAILDELTALKYPESDERPLSFLYDKLKETELWNYLEDIKRLKKIVGEIKREEHSLEVLPYKLFAISALIGTFAFRDFWAMLGLGILGYLLGKVYKVAYPFDNRKRAILSFIKGKIDADELFKMLYGKSVEDAIEEFKKKQPKQYKKLLHYILPVIKNGRHT